MQTTPNPTKQGVQLGTPCLQQPGDGPVSLFNLVPYQPPENIAQPVGPDNFRFSYITADNVAKQLVFISHYAEPLPYRCLSVSLRVRIDNNHVLAYSRVVDISTLDGNQLLTQEAEKLFVWNTGFKPTSKYYALLEAAQERAG